MNQNSSVTTAHLRYIVETVLNLIREREIGGGLEFKSDRVNYHYEKSKMERH